MIIAAMVSEMCFSVDEYEMRTLLFKEEHKRFSNDVVIEINIEMSGDLL